ncbi:AarF/UbiB family protein [Paucibacter sp. O1-1]|nr:AarF/UbiB family protein [Paucibacter sp. O1-1]MDA3825295.1 AarF/UbiB family protein [Paucibacter sp. O1-1]
MWDTLMVSFDAARIQTLMGILVRHGFGDLLRRLGFARLLRRLDTVEPVHHLAQWVSQPAPIRVRHALEEMGPCFVKLGQLLATRVDLFSPEWIDALSALQNAVPPVPFEAIRAEVEEALGRRVEDVFLSVNVEPLAAASIAQVHRARLHDQAEVVIKVRRPGIKPVVEADMRLLQYVAVRIEALFPGLRRFHPAGMVRQFRTLLRELDLAAECRNAERIAANFEGDPRLMVPVVHWACTNERMNVQDYVDGVPMTDLPALERAGVDRVRVARTGAQLVLKMMFRDGFFHADPHSGNVFVLSDGRVGLVDFGMVGHLSPNRKDEVARLLYALVERDAEPVMAVLLDWADDPNADGEQLAADVDAFIDRFHGVPLGQLDLAAMLLDISTLMRQNQLALPADLALLIKVCLTLDGMGRRLDPGFDMATQARPLLRQALMDRYRPRRLARQGLAALADFTDVITMIPGSYETS